MIQAAELKKNYRLVHGNPADVTGIMGIADLHVHESGDATDTSRRIIASAVRQGIDLIAVTNHDSADGYERASRIRDRLTRKKPVDHQLTIVRAAEVTAADKRHVLVYNLKQHIPVGLRLEHLLEEVDKQGATVSMAHPELGNFSTTEKDIEVLLKGDNPPFALEVHNGGAAQIDRYKNSWLPRFIRRRIPEANSNIRAKTIFEAFMSKLQGATGGSDAHNARHVGDVVTCYPAEMDIFDAIRDGRSVVMERKKLPRATATNLAVGTLRGMMLESKRRRGTSITH